ncbi:MAG: DUF5615 family PIN-like protein [Dehalococcoidia bacterium]
MPIFVGEGWAAQHWSVVGDPTAPDGIIFSWAASNDCIVFTRDLDFGTLLALAGSTKPSVVQIRAREVSPFVIGLSVVEAIASAEEALVQGGIVTVEPGRTRIRHLPIR